MYFKCVNKDIIIIIIPYLPAHLFNYSTKPFSKCVSSSTHLISIIPDSYHYLQAIVHVIRLILNGHL